MPNTIKFSTSSISNATLIGNVAFGWDGSDYGPTSNSGWYNGVTPPSGGFVVYATSASQIISATVVNNDTDLITIGKEFTGQNFTSSAQTQTYLNANGYAVATQVYSGNYSYSTTVLTFPTSSAGYTLYNGGFTGPDDGYSNTSVTLPTTFKTNNQSSSLFFLSTNGYFTLGAGDGTIYAGPTNAVPATMAANCGDNWLQPGLVNTDGDTQNWYYRTGSDGGNKCYIKNIVYAGIYQASTTPTTYLINFYRDNNYQWLETRIKSGATSRGNAGPYNVSSVAQAASTISRVWRGDLNGLNWVYMGTGSVTL